MIESSSYEERHARAADTFAVFVPGVDPDRVAASLERRLGALGTFAFDVVGEMWARPELARRDRSLIVVSTLAAQARDEELELHTEIAIRNGLTRVEVEEIVVTVAAYAGFPAAMAAMRRVDAGLRAAEGGAELSARAAATAKSDDDRERDAAELSEVTPDAGSADALGGVGVLARRWVFGEVWARPELTRRDRSLAVIAILTSLGVTGELAVHVEVAVRNGVAREEIEAALTHLTLYAGVPRAQEAMRVARDVFARLDA
jgi:4-carboxymuconolactone decarboxylase